MRDLPTASVRPNGNSCACAARCPGIARVDQFGFSMIEAAEDQQAFLSEAWKKQKAAKKDLHEELLQQEAMLQGVRPGVYLHTQAYIDACLEQGFKEKWSLPEEGCRILRRVSDHFALLKENEGRRRELMKGVSKARIKRWQQARHLEHVRLRKQTCNTEDSFALAQARDKLAALEVQIQTGETGCQELSDEIKLQQYILPEAEMSVSQFYTGSLLFRFGKITGDPMEDSERDPAPSKRSSPVQQGDP